MFLGHFRHGVDAKGRVAVPAQYRRGLPEGSVVTVGTEGRLVIRPPDAWRELEGTHRLTAQTPEDERRLIRTLFANARPLELDGQGRMLLDAGHRRWAQIGERAVFAGLGEVVEIVGEGLWDGEQAGLDPDGFTALNDAVMTRAGSHPAGAPQPA